MADLIHLLTRNPADHETPILRFSNDLQGPISQVFGLETPSAFFTWAVETHSEKRCLAFRRIIAHVQDTRLLGDWRYFTFAEVGQRVREMGAGLKKLLTGRKVQRLHMAAANRLVVEEFLSKELFLLTVSQRKLVHALPCGRDGFD
jgi:hypothetical protein